MTEKMLRGLLNLPTHETDMQGRPYTNNYHGNWELG